ncbi:MAG: BamA/TamA family outer membrane protein [Segetibacter sp.]
MPLHRMSDTPKLKIKNIIVPEKSVPQKDVLDIASQVFKKRSSPDSQQGPIISKPVLTVLPAAGYTLQSKLVASVSGNVVFHFNPTANLSAITASAAYTQRKQFTLPIESNIWTKNNRFNIVGDFRFYKYPQSTFGLGSSSDVQNENYMNFIYFRFYEMIQTKIAGNFLAGAGYILDYHWNILEQGTRSGVVSDYKKYGAATHTRSAGITLNALYDTRDNPINPSGGFYTNIQYRHNYLAFGSTSNWQSLIADVRKYVPFPGASENVLAFWSYNWVVLKGKPPYLDYRAMAGTATQVPGEVIYKEDLEVYKWYMLKQNTGLE